MLRVILRPAFNRRGERLHGRFVATLDGRQLCISRQPLLDAARVLIAEGIDPATPIATRHAGAGFDAMTSTVGTAAKWTVREDNTVSPTFVRWRPFPVETCSHPCVLASGQYLTHLEMRPGASMTATGCRHDRPVRHSSRLVTRINSPRRHERGPNPPPARRPPALELAQGPIRGPPGGCPHHHKCVRRPRPAMRCS